LNTIVFDLEQYVELLKIEEKYEKYKTNYSYLLINFTTLRNKDKKTSLEKIKDNQTTSEQASHSKNRRKGKSTKSRKTKNNDISEPQKPTRPQRHMALNGEKPSKISNIPCTFKPGEIPNNVMNPEEASDRVKLYEKLYKYLRDCENEIDKREKCYYKPRPVLGMVLNFNQWAEMKIIAMMIADYIVIKHDLYDEKAEVLEVYRDPLLEDLFGARNILKRDIFQTFRKYMMTSTVPGESDQMQ